MTNKEKTFLQNLSGKFANGLRAFFYRIGHSIGTNPWKTIIASWLLVLLCSIGLLNFHNEKNALKLWIPKDSKFISDTEWLMKTFERVYRIQSVLITSPDDILQPHILQKISHISNEVTKLKANQLNGSSVDWDNVCYKIPFLSYIFTDDETAQSSSQTAKSDSRPFDASVDFNSFIYCTMIDMLSRGCYQENFLELWNLNEDIIRNLSKDDIVLALNRTKINPRTGHVTDFVHLLGGIERNETGQIVSAKSLLTHWMVFVNFADADKIGNDAGTEDWASQEALLWETEFLKLMKELEVNLSTSDMSIYYSAGRSFGDISAETMFEDMDKLCIGIILMFIYMQVVLSEFSPIKFRIWLGSLGLVSVGMAFISAVGICSALGISYGPVHTCLPFLLMGLGVDDIFVIMACWKQVSVTNKNEPIAERIGLMLKHAGSSVTVTSVTDVVAFLIAGTTVLPSLRSFCIYCAIGVFLTYIFAVTFVVAILTLDQKRIESKRNACLPCVVHRQNNVWCEYNLMEKILKTVYIKFVFTKAGKIIVITLTLAFAATSIQSLLRLEQKFDPTWLVPERTYLYKYMMKQQEFYPDNGHDASIFLGSINYAKEMPKILMMIDEMELRSDLIHQISAWPGPFRDFVRMYYGNDIVNYTLTDYKWKFYLSKFLFSKNGGKYQPHFKFDGTLKCGQPTPDVIASSISFRYRRFNERNKYVTAMHEIDDIVEAANIDGFATAWAKIYSDWLTDEIIDREVLRNISLALICVMACTSLIIVNIQTCFYIFICVLLTLINVCGFMQRWGLTIDLVSCVALQLAVGLCVDYAAHIGHTFLTISNGSRTHRSLETVLHIGAAVFYGGGSTLLALAMLSNSDAYTFKSFFKIFFLMITFGLFNGVVFLPVLLSYIGPEPYQRIKSSDEDCLKDDKMGVEIKTIRDEQDTFICSDNKNKSINGGKLTSDNEDGDDDDEQDHKNEQN